MLGQNFANDGAEVCGQHKVAPFVELLVGQARPFAIDVAALHVATHHEHAIRVAVIGAAVAVFLRRTAELAHGHHNHIRHAISHVLVKGRQSLPEIFQQIRKLPLHAAFIDVVVPATAINKQHFDADVSF